MESCRESDRAAYVTVDMWTFNGFNAGLQRIIVCYTEKNKENRQNKCMSFFK